MPRNTFQGGMVMDAAPALQPPTTVRMAMNAVRASGRYKSFGYAAERSTKVRAAISGKILGFQYVEQLNASLIFHIDGGSSISLFDHATYTVTPVVKDSEFGCNWAFDACEHIYGEVKKHGHCDDILVYFTAGCVYYVVNVTEMLDATRKQSAIECEDCEHFTTFSDVCRPNIRSWAVHNSSSTMEGGAVTFVVRYEDSDGNQSNWFSSSQTVYLGTKDNAPGQQATNAVRLSVRSTDQAYAFLTIGVIKTSAGVVTAEVLDTLTLSTGYGTSYLYYGQKGRPVDIATFTTVTKSYLRGQDMIQHDGRMFYYNIKNERNLDYQSRANGIALDYVVYEVGAYQQRQHSYPSFMRGETYAFGIVWNYNDGTYSKAFPIGCGGNTSTATAKSRSSIDTAYRPFSASNFKTEDAVKRKRNPGSEPDVPQAFEDSVTGNIANYQTDEQAMIDAAGCVDSHGQAVCCDTAGLPTPSPCSAASTAMAADLNTALRPLRDTFETLGQMGEDAAPEDVTTGNTTTLRQAAKFLTDRAVTNREYTEYKRTRFVYQAQTNQSAKPPGGDTKTVSDRNDNWREFDDPNTPRLVETSSGPLKVVSSSVLYPDTKNCAGERMFPTGNICHHRMPTVSEEPHFVSRTNGVENRFQPHNDPYGNATIRLLGIRAKDVPFPAAGETPKPLCPNNPYSIVYVKRTEANKTVIAAGYTTGMFQGEVNGQTFAFPRHGVNSFEIVDRSIASGADGTSRMGQTVFGNDHGYNFHSPDTELAAPFLSASIWRDGLSLKGNGWRYGLYAKGRQPEDPYNGQRVDNAGARVANNLNHYDLTSDQERGLTFATYAPANSVVTHPEGRTDLVNRYRESSVWIGTNSDIPGNERDLSFAGDVLIHEAPTSANAAYGYLIRPLPDQYGPIHNRMYIRTGVEGFGNSTSVSGVAGDVFIGPFSKRRTSYVSNKVGNTFKVDTSAGGRVERSICESSEDTLFELLGFTINHTKLPESGDRQDPKNWSGLQTNDIDTFRPDQVNIGLGSQSDTYWPGTLKSLVHVFCESHVNTNMRQYGDESNGEIVYPGIRRAELDSHAPDISPWEDAWLNRFYRPIEQPSKAQEAKVVLIKTILLAIIPAAYLARIADMESLMEVVGELFVASGLNAIWATAVFTLFTNRRVSNLLGLPQCKTDDEGGDLDQAAIQLEDQYSAYNWDYSTRADHQPILSIPRQYNTCVCDDCFGGDEYGQDDQTNGEIYYTNKQSLDSEVDAYRTVRINQYNELPAHAGSLQRLFLQNGNMYAHTSSGIWTIQLGVGNLPADIGSQLTGAGQLMARPILLLDSGRSEGYAGTTHPNAAINVPAWGYFFLDQNARKVYRFNGRPEEISAYGASRFWREYMPFCDTPQCKHDETHNRRYELGWDYDQNVVLITKHDGPYSFTISYSPEGQPGQWTSFHSYTPSHYAYDRASLFAIHGGQIHQHHAGRGYLNFYGKSYEHFLEGTLVDAQSLKYFDLMRLTLLTESRTDADHVVKETFDQLAVWSANGSTGNRPITPVIVDNTRTSQREMIEESHDTIPAFYRNDEWDITQLHNVLDRPCNEGVIIQRDTCKAIPTILDNVNCRLLLSQDYERRFIGGRYVHFRLTKNAGDNQLLTYAIDWQPRPRNTD